MSDAAEPSAGEARRTPRFEARANARKKAEQKNAIGLSTVQGAVSGLKDYAAVHALKEGAPFHSSRTSSPKAHTLAASRD